MTSSSSWLAVIEDLAELAKLQPGFIVPFVGSGVSRSVGLPTWSELAEKVLNTTLGFYKITEDEVMGLKVRTPLEILTQCRSRLGDDIFYRQVSLALNPGGTSDTPDVAKLAWRLNSTFQVTTNLDTILEQAGTKHLEKFPISLTPKDAAGPIFASSEPRVLHLHGVLSRFDTWVMTQGDYEKALDPLKPAGGIFKALLLDRVFLFIGFSCNDEDLNTFLRQFKDHFPTGRNNHYALLPDPTDAEVSRLAALGIFTIRYSPSSHDHPEIRSFLEQLLVKINPDKATRLAESPQMTPHGMMLFAPPATLQDFPLATRRTKLDEEFRYLYQQVRDYILTKETGLPPMVQARRNEVLGYLAGAWEVGIAPPFNALYGYEVLEEVGRGAFGKVWKVKNVLTGEIKALKVAHFTETDKFNFVDRFKRGIGAMMRLTHHGIADTVKYHSDHEVPLCVFMEYIEGKDLSKLTSDYSHFDFDTRIRLARDIARIVASAHEIRVYHRDLKPSNVLIKWDPEGNPAAVLSDFDLAWYEGALSRTSTRLGDQAFAAPEQLREGPNVKARAEADVYALGTLTLYLVRKEMPFGSQWLNTNQPQEVASSVQRQAKWKVSAGYLASLIGQCTLLSPEGRPTAAKVAENLNVIWRAEAEETVPDHLFLEEIKLRSEIEALARTVAPNGAASPRTGTSCSLELRTSYGTVALSLTFKRDRQDSDDRGRFRLQAERAVTAVSQTLSSQGWQIVSKEQGHETGRVSLEHPVGKRTLDEAKNRSAEIGEAWNAWLSKISLV